jgi:hypothetical protein
MQDGDCQMRRRSKAEQPYAFSRLYPCHPKTTETDDTGAQEWRCLKIIESCWEWENEITAREGEFSVAAVDGVARECGRVAKVLVTPAAIRAVPIGAAKPRDANADADWKLRHRSGCYLTHDLVTRNQRLTLWRQLAFDNVQIRPANATRPHSYQDVTRLSLRLGQLTNVQRAFQDACG